MLKNYTSSVPASKSISDIEQQLADHGARDIMKRYDANRRVESLMFIIPIGNFDYPYKLDPRIRECEVVLTQNMPARAQPATKKKIPEQAERTAWKIMYDWIAAEMARIELGQVKLQQLLLPYLYNYSQDKTYYDMIEEKGIHKLLPSGNNANNAQ